MTAMELSERSDECPDCDHPPLSVRIKFLFLGRRTGWWHNELGDGRWEWTCPRHVQEIWKVLADTDHRGAKLRANQGISSPDSKLKLPAVGPKDVAELEAMSQELEELERDITKVLAETDPAGSALAALLVQFDRDFSPKDQFVNSILDRMRTREGRTYREWISDRTPVKTVVNAQVQDEYSRTARAVLEFSRMLGESVSLENLHQADFEGSGGIKGYIFSYWTRAGGRLPGAPEGFQGHHPKPGERSLTRDEWKRQQREERSAQRKDDKS